MTGTERSHYTLTVIIAVTLLTHLSWSWAAPQDEDDVMAQPRLLMREGYQFLEFDNGSQWYLRNDSVQAIWGVPPDEQEKMGFATKIFGNGYEIVIPYNVTEVVDQLYESEIERMKALRAKIKQD